ncbi:MAG: hypothetical protein EXS05_22120 [Planctomycetaceae bacterium]|nr:hypothetical protein [Planctomycetaceae bacterium]
MATPGKPLPRSERERIIRLRAMGLSIRRVAAVQAVSTRTVQKVLRGKPLSVRPKAHREKLADMKERAV